MRIELSEFKDILNKREKQIIIALKGSLDKWEKMGLIEHLEEIGEIEEELDKMKKKMGEKDE